jgi:type IV fimbrial biogenesis protein FimT
MTLVELVVTLTVVAILASVAAPSFSDMLINNRLTALNNQVVSAINYTRSEAVKRVYNAVMCVRNSDGSGCTTDTSLGFEAGWIVFMNCNPTTNTTPDTASNVCDANGDGTLDSPESILLDSKPDVMSGITITSNFTSNQKIGYKPTGSVLNGGTLTINTDSTARYKITIAPVTGRVSSCKVGTTGC